MAYERLLVSTNLFFTGVSILGWLTLLLQPAGWLKKVTALYSIDAGLFKVKTSEGMGSMALGGLASLMSPQAQNALSKMHRRTYGLQEFREYVCQLDHFPGLGQVCSIWNQVQLSSWLLVLIICVCFIMFLVAGVVDYYHNFVKARAASRQWVVRLHLTLPVLLLLGLLQYTVLASEVSSMPPLNNAQVLGPNVMIAWFFVFLSALPFAFIRIFGGPSPEEIRNEEASAAKAYEHEYNMQQGYGAVEDHGKGGAGSSSAAGMVPVAAPQQGSWSPWAAPQGGAWGAPQAPMQQASSQWMGPPPPFRARAAQAESPQMRVPLAATAQAGSFA